MKRVVKLTEGDVQRIAERIIVERLGVPDNISETAENIVTKVYNDFIRNTESYGFGETPDSIQIFDNFRIGDYEFDEIIVSIIPNQNFRSKDKPVLVSFQLASESRIENYRLIRAEEPGRLRINIIIATGEEWTVKQVAEALAEENDKFISVFAHELHHSYVAHKTPSEDPTKQTEYNAVQSLHFENIRPMYDFLFYLYYGHAIEDIVRPSEVYSSMRTQNITKSEFKKFFEENPVVQMLKKIRNFKTDNMIRDLYGYIPQIDEFFDQVESNKHLPFKIPGRGNTDEEKIHAFLYVVYNLIIYYKIGSYGEFLDRTVEALDPIALLFGGKAIGEKNIQNMVNSFTKRDELLQKYANKIARVNNYRQFFGNEEKRLNFVGDKTIKKLSKLYDMAKDNTSSSIVDWDLHHDINKTAEKTIQEVKKLFREGKLKITPPTESDLKYIKDRKPKL